MAVPFHSKAGLAIPDHGTDPWSVYGNANWQALATIASMSNVWWVDPEYTIANLFGAAGVRPPACRFYDTLQGAINAAQAAGYASNSSIMVAPATYPENLTITRSVHLYNILGSALFGMQGAARQPIIEGLASSQNPLITIDVPDGENASIGFHGLNFENRYNGDTSGSGLINKAYLLDGTLQGAFNANPVWVGFKSCALRMQTWGYNNEWLYGIRLNGFYYAHLIDCEIFGGSYAGGDPAGAPPPGVGGVCYLMFANGGGASNAGTVRLRDCRVSRSETGSLAAASRVLYVDGTCNASCYDSRFTDPAGGAPLYTVGGTGTNSITGLSAAGAGGVPNSYGNLFNVNMVFV